MRRSTCTLGPLTIFLYLSYREGTRPRCHSSLLPSRDIICACTRAWDQFESLDSLVLLSYHRFTSILPPFPVLKMNANPPILGRSYASLSRSKHSELISVAPHHRWQKRGPSIFKHEFMLLQKWCKAMHPSNALMPKNEIVKVAGCTLALLAFCKASNLRHLPRPKVP